MDAITKEVLEVLAARNPGASVRLSHQFLDGTDGSECGFVPNDWSGHTVRLEGQWWRA